jgi:hypothetical protein
MRVGESTSHCNDLMTTARGPSTIIGAEVKFENAHVESLHGKFHDDDLAPEEYAKNRSARVRGSFANLLERAESAVKRGSAPRDTAAYEDFAARIGNPTAERAVVRAYAAKDCRGNPMPSHHTDRWLSVPFMGGAQTRSAGAWGAA